MNNGPSKRNYYRTIRIVISLTCVYLGLLLVLYLFENQLVYPGSRYPNGNWSPNFVFEEVTLLAEDGTELVGWFLPGPNDDPQAAVHETILLFHGNAENVAQSTGRLGQLLQKHLNAEVFVIDYRGYGKSKGTPHQAGLLQDAEAALNWLMDRTGKSSEQIILFGHSLGGGPACYLAATYGSRALFLDRTFSSLVAAAQWNYPIFPVSGLMKNRFPSIEWIAKYEGPVFIAHGTNDRLIPITQARELYEAVVSDQKYLLEIEGWGHWDEFEQNYWEAVTDFYRETIQPL